MTSPLPTHHPPEDVLMDYAAGTAPEAVGLIVACHATLCPTCRERIAECETIGGALLEKAEPAEVSDGLLQTVLAEIDRPPPARVDAPVDPGDGVLPRPLARYVGDFQSLRWRFVLPGVRQVVLPIAWNGVPVRLSRVRPGFRVPHHTHTDLELHLVLTGGYTESGKHFARGDLQAGDVGIFHEIAIDPGPECVTLIVNSSRIVQTSMIGRLFAAVTGL